MKSLLVFSSLFTSAYAFSGYLDNLASSSPLSGAGITEYTDRIPSTSTPTHGAGITSYLDTIGGSATVPEVPVIPAPLPTAVTEAPIDSPATISAPAAVDYLSTLNTGMSISGAGIVDYVDCLSTNPTCSGTGASLSGYLASLSSNTVSSSGAGLTGHVDALMSNTAIAGTGTSPAAIGASGNFMQNVYSQIMDLSPKEVEDVGGKIEKSGDDVSFAAIGAKGSNVFSMSFVKQGK